MMSALDINNFQHYVVNQKKKKKIMFNEIKFG